MFKNIMKLASAAVLGLGVMLGGTATTQACDTYCYHQVWVTSYECRDVPYTVCVTEYDHCGHAYNTYKTLYRTIRVPFQKLVTVAY